MNMKLYNFGRFSGGKRLWKGTLYTLPIALGSSVLLGILQNIISLQLSLTYLLVAYIIANTFRKYGRSVSINASYISIAIFVLSIFIIDLFTVIGVNIPSFGLLTFFTPLFLANILDVRSIPSIINLLIIVYSINIVYRNSRIV